MRGELAAVEQQVGIRVLEPLTGVVPGQLRYDPADPYAATLVTLQPGHTTLWLFARDLLLDGLTATVQGPAGVGNVRVWCRSINGRRMVIVRVASRSGWASLALFQTSVSAFLDETLRLVPRGREREHLDLDETVARLLAPKPRRPKPSGGGR